MSNHTPGPWVFRDGSIFADKKGEDCIAFPHTRPRQAAAAAAHNWERYDVLFAEESANARLIAAAPDLLDAILKSDDAHWTPAMRAAIAKATEAPA